MAAGVGELTHLTADEPRAGEFVSLLSDNLV